MFVSEIRISNFRDISEKEIVVKLDRFIVLDADNDNICRCVLAGLQKVFDRNDENRRIYPSDFHLEPGEDADDKRERFLHITVKISFSEEELSEDGLIPQFFHQMRAEKTGELYCLIELSAVRISGAFSDGYVEQELNWLLPGNLKRKVQLSEFYGIEMMYIPAYMDAVKLKSSVKELSEQLLHAVKLSFGVKKKFSRSVSELYDLIYADSGIKSINDQIGKICDILQSENIIEKNVPKTLRHDIFYSFYLENIAAECDDEEQLYFFYFMLVIAYFQQISKLKTVKNNPGFTCCHKPHPCCMICCIDLIDKNIRKSKLPFAAELLDNLSENFHVQIVVTSAGIPQFAGNILPENIRCVGNKKTVSSISLPENETVRKYMKIILKENPAIYSADTVIICPSDDVKNFLTSFLQYSVLLSDRIVFITVNRCFWMAFFAMLEKIEKSYRAIADFDKWFLNNDCRALRIMLQQGIASGVMKTLLDSNGSELQVGDIENLASDFILSRDFLIQLEEKWGIYFNISGGWQDTVEQILPEHFAEFAIPEKEYNTLLKLLPFELISDMVPDRWKSCMKSLNIADDI